MNATVGTGLAGEIGRRIDLYERRRAEWEHSPKPVEPRWCEVPELDWEGDVIGYEYAEPVVDSDHRFARMILARNRLESLMRAEGVHSATSRRWHFYFGDDGRLKAVPIHRRVMIVRRPG